MLPVKLDKRPTLNEEIKRMRQLDDGQILDILHDLKEDDLSYVGLRWQTASTQKKQDAHLALYHLFLKHISKEIEDDMSQDQIRDVAFPADSDLLSTRLRLFIGFVFKFQRSRSRKSGLRMQYLSLASYRTSVLFWTRRAYHERKQDPGTLRVLWNQITEAMRGASIRYGDGPRGRVAEHTFLGLDELRQLIDYEMATNACIELSEQHQLAWCIGRQTAVRPGSIGAGRDLKDTIRWADLTFTWNGQPGKFDVHIVFRNVKTNLKDPEVGKTAIQRTKPLDFHVTSPEAHNLIFSVPHRLLVIAIRRGILKHINSVAELMAQVNRHVLVKKEHLQDFVFYAGTQRGLSINRSKPLNAEALTQYLSLRGYAIGYKSPITFYSIRKRTATDLIHEIGIEATRDIMGHSPESRTLERYYLFFRPTLDIAAATLGQAATPAGSSAAAVKNWAPLALSKLDDEAMGKIRGPALNAMCRQLIQTDESFDPLMSDADMKNYKRRVRSRAMLALIQEEQERQIAQQTFKDWESRQKCLAASQFAAAVLTRAQALMSDRDPEASLLAAVGQDVNTDCDALNDDFADEEDLEPEPDAEDQSDESQTRTVCIDNEDEAFIRSAIETEEPRRDYGFEVTAMMDLLMENTLAEAPWKYRTPTERTCPLCIADDTMDLKAKGRVFKSEGTLKNHMFSQTHSPQAQWRRRLHANGRDGLLFCPYCQKPYDCLQNVERHIQKSTIERDGAAHEEMKRNDGWYRDDWMGVVSQDQVRQRKKEVARQLESLGVTFERELDAPIPHESCPGITRGPDTNPFPTGIPDTLRNVVALYPNAAAAAAAIPRGVPASLKSIVSCHSKASNVRTTSDTMSGQELRAKGISTFATATEAGAHERSKREKLKGDVNLAPKNRASRTPLQ